MTKVVCANCRLGIEGEYIELWLQVNWIDPTTRMRITSDKQIDVNAARRSTQSRFLVCSKQCEKEFVDKKHAEEQQILASSGRLI